MKLFILIFFSSISLLSNTNNENSNSKNIYWNHIYSRDRLVIFKDTMKVTGVVKSIHGGFDGDLHINLKLDSGLNHLLNENNLNTEDSCLVLELICVNKSIFSECKGYKNTIKIPKTGDHIEVIGSYVYDKRHGIMEIHPVFDLFLNK